MKKPPLLPILLLLLLLLLSSCRPASLHTPITDRQTDSPVSLSSPLTVYFLHAGEADCILLHTTSHVIVLDTGEADDSEQITRSLDALGFDRVDLLILTHPDADHIGGAPHLLSSLPVDRVLYPDYQKDSEEQTALLHALDTALPSHAPLTEAFTLSLEDTRITVYPPILSPKGENASNESSLGVLVEHGNNRLFFAGDAGGARIDEMLSQIEQPETIDLLKLPHHGRFDRMSDSLIETLHPSVSVICCDDPRSVDQRIRKLINSVGSDLYLTAYGTLMVQSDGNRLHVED